MICPTCRSAQPAGSRFCNACGARLGAPAASPPPEQTQAYSSPAAPAGPAPGYAQPGYGAAGYTQPGYAAAHPSAAAPAAGRKTVLWAIVAAVLLLCLGAGAIAFINARAQSVVAAPAGNPSGGSVTSIRTPDAPPAPGVTNQGTPPPPAAGGVTAQPAAPPAPQQGDFDAYLRWLRYVENERKALRAHAETQSYALIDRYLGTLLDLSNPDANDQEVAGGLQQKMDQMARDTAASIDRFIENIRRTKPAVPADCGALDNYYMTAAVEEARLTRELMAAMASKDMGRVKSISSSGVGTINENLSRAENELQRVLDGRGRRNENFHIATGGNSSMMGGLMGMPGMR